MTTMASVPSVRVKALLSSLGFLDGWTIEETGVTYEAPVVQLIYPNETASNVSDTNSILAIQELGSNSNTVYNQDLNMLLHLWTPTNGTAVYPYYNARLQEIALGLKGSSNNGVYPLGGSPVNDGLMDSGRMAYHIALRVIIGDLD